MKIRSLSLAGAGLAGVLMLGLPAQAHAEPDQLIVVRDAETGQLRAPTASEMAGLQAAKAQASAVQQGAKTDGRLNLHVRSHASGAVNVRSTDELASYAVVARRADGSLAEACFDSKRAADQAVSTGIPPVSQQQAEEK